MTDKWRIGRDLLESSHDVIEHLSRNFHGGGGGPCGEPLKTSVSVASDVVRIRIGNIPNSSLEGYRYENLLGH
jgi:hypothetical protein